ncbi:hypothetical protein [Spirilliplanes yamanashiensis]|uniref:Uncharacterized protein n=1 Tax=Spirilliplanes yamanashiensis TaxID=42233 RepID=A0A8J3Y7J1_9ACTN|nr:hypothetical protein [Spirilliplanes yamanashiensis]MDP9816992.1 hypothetical protein [Spirilliplanes yamanashiensis]GIJ03351.1 hypothetical protein Sya03_27030 [Spirilliplanes yamanashiensis]
MGAGDWQWTDAWIFVAAVIAERLERDRAAAAALPVAGATLADVLAAAAFLHDGVPGRDDLENAVRRLAGAGLLTVDDDMVTVAPAGEQLWRTRPFRGLSSAVVTMQTQLNRVAKPGMATWALDEPTYAAALLEYSRRDGA